MNEHHPGFSRRRGLRALISALLVMTVCALGSAGRSYYAAIQAMTVAYDDRSKEFAAVPAQPTASAATDADESAQRLILTAPLFVQGRGIPAPPVQPVQTPTQPAAPEPELRLVGIEFSAQTRLAILQLSDQPNSVRAVEGQPVGSWTVTRIYRDHVDLNRQLNSRSIYLGDTKPPADNLSSSE